ncbi:hypothetical protein SAMN03159463_05471 [Mesorhizobium sp. NFR06]|uniref:hypothetical protein n=1 Tax=Mesorhizobium sp. NFR06 TaxID=1566290 RepID=UPI0008F16D49|nr:hypothetical protein [Mesorhizobium sp. NFR06]SFQ04546.1 hypothetical protein SAMN03159463_05471 [Mesorhizobium sp. NFR06]
MTDQNSTAPSLPSGNSSGHGHHRQAIVHLARAMGGLTTTIRAVGSGRDLTAPFTLEPLGWTDEALTEFERLSEASRDAGAVEDSDDLTAVSPLALVAEAISQALESLVAGEGTPEVLRYALMADSYLTQFVRMIPEEEYKGAIRDTWGREAMPVRLR